MYVPRAANWKSTALSATDLVFCFVFASLYYCVIVCAKANYSHLPICLELTLSYVNSLTLHLNSPNQKGFCKTTTECHLGFAQG